MKSIHAAPAGPCASRGRSRFCLFVVGALALGIAPMAEAGTSTSSQRPASEAVPAVRSAQVGPVARQSKVAGPARSARAASRVARPRAPAAAPAPTLPSALDLLRGRTSGSSPYAPLADISCVAPGGNWSSPATWSGGVPTAADRRDDRERLHRDDRHGGDSAQPHRLQRRRPPVRGHDRRTLAVGDYVTVDVGGIFQSAATGTQTGHVLSVGGSLTNAGTIDFSTNTDTAGAGIVFTGAASTSRWSTPARSTCGRRTA